MNGTVFNIQRFSLHDGRGIRTVVFLKGCSLRCKWCHNPESHSEKSLLSVRRNLCTGCGACLRFCSFAFTDRCDGCGKCVSVCPRHARQIFGKNLSSAEVFAEINKDKAYYKTSNGGVTFSGGEPFLQSDFLCEILRTCQENGISTAVETAGNVPYSAMEKCLPYIDLFLYDIKAFSLECHLACTGSDNRIILENAERLKTAAKKIIFRTPVVGGYNDRELPSIANFVRPYPWEILRYNALGAIKYENIGQAYPVPDAYAFSEEEMSALAKQYGAIYSPTGF